MKASPLLEFESSAFGVTPGEDAETNPGIYGKALAEWLAEQLQIQGQPAGEIIAEDFGWCVGLDFKPYRLYVACSSTEEGPGHWRVFAFAEGGLLHRLLGKDESAAPLDSVFSGIKDSLAANPAVHNLREHAP